MRTVDGYIRQVTQVNEKGSYDSYCWGACIVDTKYKNSIGISNKKIKSHSPNIIDLIEVGDFVNRREVIGKFIEDGKIVLVLDTKLDTKFIKNKVYEEDIKDIVTHEQFESMKYIVGGKEE